MKRTYDVLEDFDERSRQYPIKALTGAAPLRDKTWRLMTKLDQGSEGACVGFGWTHEIAASPNSHPVTKATALSIYHQAQKVDEWEGEAYDGTSVLAGAKVVKARKLMREYRWAFGLEDVLRTLSTHGPVVIGTNWYADMEQVGEGGFITPTGEFRGRHCTLLRGLKKTRGKWRVTGSNSWSRWWGIQGDYNLWEDDLGTLLDKAGEACVPVGRA